MFQWLGLSAFTAMAPGLIPGLGTKILQDMQRSQKKRESKDEASKSGEKGW